MYYLIGIIFAFLCMVFVGGGDFSSGLSARKINEKLSIVIIFFSQTIFSVFLWIIFVHSFQVSINLLIFAVIAGIFQTIGLFYFYKAMTLESIALISPIFATASLITILYGIIFLKEPLSFSRVLAMGVIVIGTIFASTDFSFTKSKVHVNNKGALFALLGSLLFGIGLVFITFSLKRGEFYFYNSVYALVTCLAGGIFFYKDVRKGISHPLVNKKNYFIPLLVGLFYTLANTFYGLSLKALPSYLSAAIFSAYPAVTVMLGYIFLKERLKLTQMIGVLGITIGLVIVSLV